MSLPKFAWTLYKFEHASKMTKMLDLLDGLFINYKKNSQQNNISNKKIKIKIANSGHKAPHAKTETKKLIWCCSLEQLGLHMRSM